MDCLSIVYHIISFLHSEFILNFARLAFPAEAHILSFLGLS